MREDSAPSVLMKDELVTKVNTICLRTSEQYTNIPLKVVCARNEIILPMACRIESKKAMILKVCGLLQVNQVDLETHNAKRAKYSAK